MEKISTRLKKARNEKGWTQADLSVRAGVSTGTIGNIESDARLAKGSIPQIAKALGVNYDWLQDGTGDMYHANTAPPAQSYYLTESPTNQPVARMDTAQLAIKVELLHQTLGLLSDALEGVNQSKRVAIGALLTALANDPKDAQLLASIEAFLTPVQAPEVRKKVA
jgi:transcriptional regulator with XRE-family HTH domain